MAIAESKKLEGIIVDCTHLGRNTTGIERITEELFLNDSFDGLNVVDVRSKNTLGLILKQWFGLVFYAVKHRKLKLLFPGFPPSILMSVLFPKRTLLYVHDLFLITREEDLNPRAKLYMKPSFSYAIKNLKTFLVNSQKTKKELLQHCLPDADIFMYRPEISNIFGLEPALNNVVDEVRKSIKVLMVGTVEPRKNYSGAVEIVHALSDLMKTRVELHVVGRYGWDDNFDRLNGHENVYFHGYASQEEIRMLAQEATFFLSTSHDEGLGLPLLEMQYSGLQVIASDIDVFREVLGESGIYIDSSDPQSAAQTIQDFLIKDIDPHIIANQALSNIDRWNNNAKEDKVRIEKLLAGS